MSRIIAALVSTLVLLAAHGWADEVDKTNAAIGGGVGGAVGAVVGAELGDRNGAIVGSALGAAVGTAVATEGDNHHDGHRNHAGAVVEPHVEVHVVGNHGHGYGKHCPPGQAKKGRC